MRLNILLPVWSDEPIGGLKVQYEYANRLSEIGFDVALYHSLCQPWIPRNVRTLGGLVRRNIRGNEQVSWFPLASAVKSWCLPGLDARFIRRADATILTAFTTSEDIGTRTSRLGALLQIVYDYEFWCTGDLEYRDRIARAFQREDVFHIATSRSVQEMLDVMGVRSDAYIPCGVDIYPSTAVRPMADRTAIVGFPLRKEPHKGVPEMLAAVEELRILYPSAEFEAFGSWPAAGLPRHIRMHGRISDIELRAFYQRCAVFVLPSYVEGWGLPAAEAMANGAAVVVADNGGSADFAIDGETALVVPPRDSRAIAKAVSRLLRDDSLRSQLSANGLERTKSMGWDLSTSLLAGVLRSVAAHNR